jgi:hypothetical protein
MSREDGPTWTSRLPPSRTQRCAAVDQYDVPQLSGDAPLPRVQTPVQDETGADT